MMTEVASYYGRQKRPRSVTVVIWGILLLALANGWRGVGLSQQSDLLLALESSLNPWVGLGLAFGWSIFFIIGAVTLWQRLRWTRYTIPGFLLLHGIYQILLVVLFARSTASRNAWPVIGLLFMLATLFSVWALYRPSVRWYFR